MKKIAFAGTDGRTLLWARIVSTATSEKYEIIMRGLSCWHTSDAEF